MCAAGSAGKASPQGRTAARSDAPEGRVSEDFASRRRCRTQRNRAKPRRKRERAPRLMAL